MDFLNDVQSIISTLAYWIPFEDTLFLIAVLILFGRRNRKKYGSQGMTKRFVNGLIIVGIYFYFISAMHASLQKNAYIYGNPPCLKSLSHDIRLLIWGISYYLFYITAPLLLVLLLELGRSKVWAKFFFIKSYILLGVIYGLPKASNIVLIDEYYNDMVTRITSIGVEDNFYLALLYSYLSGIIACTIPFYGIKKLYEREWMGSIFHSEMEQVKEEAKVLDNSEEERL